MLVRKTLTNLFSTGFAKARAIACVSRKGLNLTLNTKIVIPEKIPLATVFNCYIDIKDSQIGYNEK